MTKKREKIDSTIFTGESEWVNVEMNGKKEVTKITIKYEENIDNDDKEMLQEMINEAQTNADQIIKRAEDTAFSEVKRQTDAAAEIKADAENQANEIIKRAGKLACRKIR